MKETKIYHGEKTLVYYSIVLWPKSGGYGKAVKDVFKTASGAERRARKELNNSKFKAATIRKNEVWARDYDCEFSSSGLYKEVEA